MSDRISNGIPYLYREVPNRKVVVFNLRSVLLTPVRSLSNEEARDEND